MNPYTYIDPPVSADILESPAKLRTKYWPEKPFGLNRKNNKFVYFLFIIGLILGFLLTSILKDLLKQNCSHDQLNKNKIELKQKKVTTILDYQKFANIKRKLIYIGVMTANKYLDSRAKAIYETWGKHVPGDIGFFSSENSYTEENIPLITLTGVDDTYPPQKKSFLMLKHMYDNHLNDYEYFMRADDDVYIRTERLEKFLKSINSSKLHYIGQAGRGNPDEFGHLSLNIKENFCMGGPGMIFSKATLEKMAPHIRKCLKSLRSTHEDVEIGRCVQKYAGIPCTWSYEMQNIFYHNNSESASFTGSLKQREVHRAITLHPVKNFLYLHRLHAYIKSLVIKETEFEMIEAMREIAKFGNEGDFEFPHLDDVAGGIFVDHLGMEASLQKLAPRKESDVIPWDFLLQNSYQVKNMNPKHRMTSFVRESTSDAIRDIMEIINRLSKERGRVIDFKEVLYAYSRHHPTYASEFVFDLLLLYKKYRGKKATMAVRRHAYVQVPFGPLYLRELPQLRSEGESGGNSFSLLGGILNRGFKDIMSWAPKAWQYSSSETWSAKEEKITFIVPLAGRFEVFTRFLNDFEKVCLETSENVALIVVSFRPKVGDGNALKQKMETLMSEVRLRFPRYSLSIVQVNSTFSRAQALESGAAQCYPEDLLFFVDVDITLRADALHRIRLHTVRGKQVYYPIVFSEFDPSVYSDKERHVNDDHFRVDEVSGYWRSFGYGIVSLFNSDLRSVGGLDTSIVGWGKEDVDLFEKVLKDKRLRIVRTPDPGLVHVFHRVECDPMLEENQLKMCEGSQFNTFASLRTLARILLRKPEIFTYSRSLS